MIWRAVRLRKVPCRRHGVSDASEGHCVDYGSTWVLGVVKLMDFVAKRSICDVHSHEM